MNSRRRDFIHYKRVRLQSISAVSTPALARLRRIGPYEIVCAIGKGGMGEVWEGRAIHGSTVGPGPTLFKQPYDMDREGRFLINTDLQDASTEPIHLLLNWKPPRK